MADASAGVVRGFGIGNERLSLEPSIIVISGAGMITPLGLTRQETWRAALRGQCGAGPLSAMEQPLAAGRDGGQAPDLPEEYEPDLPREVRYLRKTLADALADAGLDPNHLPYPPERCGIMVGTTLHGMRAGGQFLRTGDFRHLGNFLASSTLKSAAGDLNIHGLAATTCSACSSSLGSVALAVTLLNSGQFDLILAGGYDPISEYVYGGFNSLRLVAEGPLRPFTRGRQGMKLAEGYAIVVLERAESAQARGNKPIAQVKSFGESADAHHLTQPHPQGEGAARAMSDALINADLSPQDIGLIAAHATGTPDNDAAEFAAMSRVFGDHLPSVPVVAFKSHLGHTLGGAGAIELVLSAMSLNEQTIPPCANVLRENIEFPSLNLAIGNAKSARIRATLNTSLGFGGANTCVILTPTPSPLFSGERAGERGSRDAQRGNLAEVAPSPQPSPPRTGEREREVLITGIGIVLPGVIGNDAFLARLNDPEKRITEDTGPVPESDIAALLNARRVRRMSEYVKLSLAATSLAFTDAGIIDIPQFTATCAAILGSTHGSAGYSMDYYRQIVDEGIPAANPMLFAEGVPNAAAAHLSLMMSIKGACQAIIGSRTAGLDALRLAGQRIAQGQWTRAVVSAGEEFCQTVNDAYRHCGMKFPIGCGAVTFILENRPSAEARAAHVHGSLTAATSHASSEPKMVTGIARMLRELGDPANVIGSANGTWLDRVESDGVRMTRRDTAVSSLSRSVAETFSVTPLLAVAAALLQRQDAGVLCTDYSGTAAGVRVSGVAS